MRNSVNVMCLYVVECGDILVGSVLGVVFCVLGREWEIEVEDMKVFVV